MFDYVHNTVPVHINCVLSNYCMVCIVLLNFLNKVLKHFTYFVANLDIVKMIDHDL